MKHLIFSTSLSLFFLFSGSILNADSVIDHPSDGVINLPISLEEGKFKLKLPKGSKTKKPVRIASCRVENFDIQIFKSKKMLKAHIYENKGGEEIERQSNWLYGITLRKEMLGQYQVVVDVAQQLGITEVDYVRIWFLDLDQKFNKALIFFYDPDNEIIDRTILIGKTWERCEEEVTCNPY